MRKSSSSFEAWVTVLNTRASQHAVDAGKGWGLAGTGQTLAIYVEDAVDLTDDSGLSFSIVAMELSIHALSSSTLMSGQSVRNP